MNTLEDAFWGARAAHLAAHAGHGARVALLVRRGKLIAQAIAHDPRTLPELALLRHTRGRAHGATLFVAHAPARAAIPSARSARIGRVILAPGVLAAPAEILDWSSAGIIVRPAPVDCLQVA